MRRLHRRAHLIVWLLILPAAFVALAHAWRSRPPAPIAEIPDAAATEAP